MRTSGNATNEAVERLCSTMTQPENLKVLSQMLQKQKVRDAIVATMSTMKSHEARGSASANLAECSS